MPLESGTVLGPYIIDSLVGAGGMGEVYKARDTRLDRIVAIKTLPESFANDLERLARFEREARTIAALNHPNVVTLFDVGSEGGRPFLVSEFLSGRTLREVLKDGRLSLRKAVAYAADIAAGLAAAHEVGMVHRDLKPENIFIVADGRAKVLDFGLARPLPTAFGAAAGATSSRTAMPTTNAGTVLGTVGYMSPEQVKGQPADHRSDIFSLGAILYEMVSGERAFQRDSSIETMHAIVRDDPTDVSERRPDVPPAVDRILRHCLEKDPDHRFQSARDLAFDLASISTTSDSSTARTLKQASSKRIVTAVAFAVVVLMIGALGMWIGIGLQSKPPHFQPLTFQRGFISNARFAPDGQTVIYSASWAARPSDIFSTTITTQESRSLGIARSAILAVSKKGELALLVNAQTEMAGFVTTGTLARTYMTGGTAPREIAAGVHGADWSPDGSILCVLRADKDADLIEYPLGTPIHRLMKPAWISDVRISPRGGLIAFIEHPEAGDDRGNVVVIDTGGKVIFSGKSWNGIYGIAWRDNARLLVTAMPSQEKASRQLFALDLHGGVRPLMELPGELTVHDATADGKMLVSLNQRNIVMAASVAGEQRDMTWLDRSIVDRVTDDGSSVLFHEGGQGGGPVGSVYLRRLDGSAAVRLGEGYGVDISPDGKWVMTTIPEHPPRYRIVPTGPGEARNIAVPGFAKIYPLGFSRDGRGLIWLASNDGEELRTYRTDLDGRNPTALAPPGHVPVAVSPSGRFEIRRLGKRLELWDYQQSSGKAITIPASDVLAGLADDGDSIYLGHPTARYTFEILRQSLRTGDAKPVATISGTDMTGVQGLNRMVVTPDGTTVVYSYTRHLSQLYSVDAFNTR